MLNTKYPLIKDLLLKESLISLKTIKPIEIFTIGIFVWGRLINLHGKHIGILVFKN